MGRELRRVPLDFDWPVGQIWKGFVNPYYKHQQDCGLCDSSGYNDLTRQLADDWYDFANTGRKWCEKITQDEVAALIAGNRLWEFTRTWTKGTGWVDRDPPATVTADQVNAWQASRTLGHDAINRMICIETRAKRFGVYGHCDECKGEGTLWDSPEHKVLCDGWEDENPPEGAGWQLWETVSEGSPITPVYATAEELIAHMSQPSPDGHTWDRGYSKEASEHFVRESGWAMSMMSIGGELMDGVTAGLASSKETAAAGEAKKTPSPEGT